MPNCAYGDVLTPNRAYADWQSTILDTRLMLGPRYVPPRLVPVAEAGIAGKGQVRAIVMKDLLLMKWAAPRRAIRSRWSARPELPEPGGDIPFLGEYDGYHKALRTSARAGHSEHQLGTTLDFKAKGGPAPWLLDDWSTTRAGAWCCYLLTSHLLLPEVSVVAGDIAHAVTLNVNGGPDYGHAVAMRRLYDLINAGDIDGFGELLAEDFVEHEEMPGLEPSKEGVKRAFPHVSGGVPRSAHGGAGRPRER